MPKMTLKDIAKVFDVSVSTVSKALHDQKEISPALRAKIKAFAKEHKYRPNRVAQSLVSQRTRTIGVLLPNILNFFFTKVFWGVEKVCNERGYTLISSITGDSHKKETDSIDFLGGGSVDGLILSLAGETQRKGKTEHLKRLVDGGIPLVMFDRVAQDIDCDKVIVDDVEGAYRATVHFLKTGCRTIALVTPLGHSSVGKLRMDGYRKALGEQGIAHDERLVVQLGKEDDLEVLMALLLSYKKVDAILALDEITAVEVQRILQAKGHRVPEDVSVIGFTNGLLSKYVTPSLTTVNQHSVFIGEQAAHILIDRIEGKNKDPEFITKTVKTSLIVRDSTRKIK